MKLEEIIINLTDLQSAERDYVFKLGRKEFNNDEDLEQLVEYMDSTIPKFALKNNEFKRFYGSESGSLDGIEKRLRVFMQRNRKVYSAYAELLLFCFLDEGFKVPKFVTKIILEGSAGGRTPTGFDCAHISNDNGVPCLWLGEAKFYSSLSDGLRESLGSVRSHLNGIMGEIHALASNFNSNDYGDVGPYTDEEIQNILYHLEGSEKSEEMEVKLVMPIFVLTNRSDTPTFSEERQKVLDKIKSMVESEVKRNGNLESDKFSDVSLKILILPVKTVRELRNKIKEMSRYG